jgi:hypothetical protein
MRIRRSIAAAAGTLAAAAPLAGVAHADDASYLEVLHSNGCMPQSPPEVMQDRQLRAGHTVCVELRGGMTKQDITQGDGDFALLVDAAQHELCPDTLGVRP